VQNRVSNQQRTSPAESGVDTTHRYTGAPRLARDVALTCSLGQSGEADLEVIGAEENLQIFVSKYPARSRFVSHNTVQKITYIILLYLK
jgi:hypothetical protein